MTYIDHKHTEEDELQEGMVSIFIEYCVYMKKLKGDLYFGCKTFSMYEDAINEYNDALTKCEVVSLYEKQTHLILEKSNMK